MRVKRVNPAERKGWYAGPWNSGLTIAVGYANHGIDAPHLHRRITEVYLVARGWSEARVERETVQPQAGDVLIVEPGESHSFLASSPDYLRFVVRVPGLPPEEARADHASVPHSRLA